MVSWTHQSIINLGTTTLNGIWDLIGFDEILEDFNGILWNFNVVFMGFSGVDSILWDLRVYNIA